MKVQNKNRIIGKITLTSNTTTTTNINTYKIYQNNNNNENINIPTQTLSTHQPKISPYHKRANSSFKFKDIFLNNNLTKIISTFNNTTTYKIIKNTNNINFQKYFQYQTTINNINNFNNLKKFRSLSPNNTISSHSKTLLPSKNSNKKTLVLDLDETLVHSNFSPFNCPSDMIIQIEEEKNNHDVHVLIRPHVQEFLERMSKKFELVIFTASIPNYANKLLDKIDKMGYVPFRLFREHCTLINTAFVKDLSKLGRNLKDVIILDNNPLTYSLNQYNGFPIKSWFDDKNDDELLKIAPILEFLSYVFDVRDYIKKIVSDNKIQFDVVKSVIANYYKELKKKINTPLECENLIKLFKSEVVLHKSKSSKINLIKNPSVNMLIKFKLKNKKRNKNSVELSHVNSYMNNNNKNSEILNSKLNLTNINIHKIYNNISNNKTMTNISKNYINNTFNYGISNGNTRRKNELKLHKLIKRKKNINTMRCNKSTKKTIKLNTKGSTFNLNNLYMESNNNYNKTSNNPFFIKANKNKIRTKLNPNKIYSSNSGCFDNKNNNINTHLRLNKSMNPCTKNYKSNINSINVQKYIDFNNRKNKIAINLKKLKESNNKNNNIKFVRPSLKNKNIILSHSLKID